MPTPQWRMTPEQRELLLDHYDGTPETLDRLLPHFPDVPRRIIRNWARYLGANRLYRHHPEISEAQARLLIRDYDSTTATLDKLMEHFPGVPRWKVRHAAEEMGLGRQKEPRWTEAEVAFLERHLVTMSMRDIAAKLGRTIIGVQLKAKRLRINKTREGYTLRGLEQAFGVDHHAIDRWIAKGWLKGKRRKTEKRHMGDLWYFSDEALRRFILAHPEEIDPRRLHRAGSWVWFIDLLANNGQGLGELALPGTDEEPEQEAS